ncbi:MAG: hypothetical protein AB1724_11305 [Thermodesulfobacteriota bacterium]
MSSNNLTLSELFLPPDGLVGQVGITCAYSASQSYVDRILETFTQRSKMHRRLCGYTNLFLMLNPHCVDLNELELPGLIWLKPHRCELWKKWIASQHAKVALLSFGKTPNGKPLCYRLVVTSGNWTESSGNQTIEMAWYLDVRTNESGKLSADDKIDILDIVAAAQFFKNLITFYSVNKSLCSRMLNLIDSLEAEQTIGKKRPRFFTSLDHPLPDGTQEKAIGRPLITSIISRLKGDHPARNMLVCGSGFFEQAGDSDLEPKSLSIIGTQLKSAKVLQKDPRKYLIANPDFCGQVALWDRSDTQRNSWEILKPSDPADAGRSRLHAKYIFVGKLQSSGKIEYGSIYIGSGNLSMMGLHSAPGQSPNDKFGKGNIEAGVVFHFDSNAIFNEDTLYKTLACGDEIDVDKNDLKSGNDNGSIPDIEFTEPPPITYFEVSGENILRPSWNNGSVSLKDDKIYLLKHNEISEQIMVGSTVDVGWEGNIPNYVKVIWRQDRYIIPVITENGMFPSQKPELSRVDDLFAFLLNYPNNNLDDNDQDDGDDGDDGDGKDKNHSIKPKKTDKSGIAKDQYPLYTSMRFVEFLADRNQHLPGPEYIEDWVNQVSATISCLSPEQITEWRSIGINFLEVLKCPDFAPPWKNKFWNALIDELVNKWGMKNMPGVVGGGNV